MKKLATLVAAAALAAGAVTFSSAPADAEPPANVTSGRHGSIDAGWVRADCAVNATGTKCAIRFPEGVRRLDMDYVHSGEWLGTETTWNRSQPARTRDAIRRMPLRRVAPGVSLKCMTVGALVDCSIVLAARYVDFNITTYSAGSMLGGLKGEGIVMVAPEPVEETPVVEEEPVVGGEVIDLAPYEEIPTTVEQVFAPVVTWTPAVDEEPQP